MNLLRAGFFVWLLALAAQVFAFDLFQKPAQTQGGFLPVDSAFSLYAEPTKTGFNVQVGITPEHYFYQDKVKLVAAGKPVQAKFSFSLKPEYVDDPEFGRVPVFFKDVVVQVTQIQAQAGTELELHWQGCAVKGLCYPPERLSLGELHAEAANLPKTASSSADTSAPAPAKPDQAEPALASEAGAASVASAGQSGALELAETSSEATALAARADLDSKADLLQAEPNSEQFGEFGAKLASTDFSSAQSSSAKSANKVNPDPFSFRLHPLRAMALMFVLGLGLALTPCVLPMLPIVSAVVAGGQAELEHDKRSKTAKGFLLAASYVLGVATSYGLLGYLFASLGQVFLVQQLQNPWVLGSMAFVFAGLAAYLMGFLSLGSFGQRVFAWFDSLQRKVKGVTFFGAFVAGVVSALVVSPCVSAPLAGALLSAATTGKPVLGFMALFLLGLGLSLPLLLLGTLQSKLVNLFHPHSQTIKHMFALLLLLLALFLLARILPESYGNWLLVSLPLLAGLWLVAQRPFVVRLLGCAAVAWFGLQAGKLKPVQQTQWHMQQAQVFEVPKLALQEAADHPKVMLVLEADWCIECRRMEAEVFEPWPYRTDQLKVIKLDVTKTTEAQRKFLTQYALVGPPALVFMSFGEVKSINQGYMNRGDWQDTVDSFLQE